MPKKINVTKAELQAALRGLKHTGPVLSAHKKGGFIILYLTGNKEPLRWRPPKAKPAPKPKAQAKVKKP